VKLSVSRQTVYILVIAFILLIVVFIFAFLFLIPKGKEYRIEKRIMSVERKNERTYRRWYEQTLSELKEMKSENRHIINAFSNDFNAKAFVQEAKESFETITLSKVEKIDENMSHFDLYEVNATSKIDSPQNFYDFLERVNKSDWIVKVNFPIRFEREGEMIRSSFTMRVYNSRYESEANASASSEQ